MKNLLCSTQRLLFATNHDFSNKFDKKGTLKTKIIIFVL